jgi:hypothetical protein
MAVAIVANGGGVQFTLSEAIGQGAMYGGITPPAGLQDTGDLLGHRRLVPAITGSRRLGYRGRTLVLVLVLVLVIIGESGKRIGHR